MTNFSDKAKEGESTCKDNSALLIGFITIVIIVIVNLCDGVGSYVKLA